MKTAKNWLPTLVVASLTLYLSTLKGSEVQQAGLGHEAYQVNGHLFLYSLLTIVLFKSTKSIIMSVILAVLYGICLEIVQLYVPGRSTQLFDILVNSFGSLISALFIWKLQLVLPKKLRAWLNQ